MPLHSRALQRLKVCHLRRRLAYSQMLLLSRRQRGTGVVACAYGGLKWELCLDHSLCHSDASSWCFQRGGGLELRVSSRLKYLEIEAGELQSDSEPLGTLHGRSVHVTAGSSTSQILQLETGSGGNGNRHLPTRLKRGGSAMIFLPSQ